MKTIVLQSQSPASPQWQQICTDSVSQWASANRFDYQLSGDELFELLPTSYREKFAGRGPILADLARLILIDDALATYDLAIWADADLLIFAPDRLRIEPPDQVLFGQESWVEADDSGRPAIWRNVHNAYIVARQGNCVTPFLRHTIESIGNRIDATHVAPQTMGPKLLGAFHNITRFDLDPSVTAFSPALTREISEQPDGPLLSYLKENQMAAPVAANMCASLSLDDSTMSKACNLLIAEQQLP